MGESKSVGEVGEFESEVCNGKASWLQPNRFMSNGDI